jgi:hypothetical protein
MRTTFSSYYNILIQVDGIILIYVCWFEDNR